MKKIYVSPEMHIHQIKTRLMQAASAEVDSNSSANPENADSRRFRFFDDEDE